MWVVYVIQHTATLALYIGFTDNLKRRIIEHNQGSNKSTRRKIGKWIFVYAEAYRSEQDARERERKLKQYGSSKQRLLKRIKRGLITG